MSSAVERASLLVLLLGASSVFHPAKVVLTLLLVDVLLGKILFVWELEDECKEDKKGENDVAMNFSAELFDDFNVVPDGLRLVLLLLVGEVLGELGNVPDLDVVPPLDSLLLEVVKLRSGVA